MRSGVVVLLLAVVLGSWWSFHLNRHRPKVSFKWSDGACSANHKEPRIRVDSALAGSIKLVSKDDNYSVFFAGGSPLDAPNPFTVPARTSQTYSINSTARNCVASTTPADDKCTYQFTLSDLDHLGQDQKPV